MKIYKIVAGTDKPECKNCKKQYEPNEVKRVYSPSLPIGFCSAGCWTTSVSEQNLIIGDKIKILKVSKDGFHNNRYNLKIKLPEGYEIAGYNSDGTLPIKKIEESA